MCPASIKQSQERSADDHAATNPTDQKPAVPHVRGQVSKKTENRIAKDKKGKETPKRIDYDIGTEKGLVLFLCCYVTSKNQINQLKEKRVIKQIQKCSEKRIGRPELSRVVAVFNPEVERLLVPDNRSGEPSKDYCLNDNHYSKRNGCDVPNLHQSL